jgi:hypothetical protein
MLINRTPILLGALVGVALAVCGEAAAADEAVRPFVKEAEPECSWWMSQSDTDKSLRASIGASSDGVTLTLSDPVFKTWSESDFHKVELRFNRDPKRTSVTEGWVSLGGGHVSMFGVFLDKGAMKAMDRATLLEIRKKGAVVMTMPLAGTPTKAELEACLPDPNAPRGDSE